jgi:hypothetical protein
VVVCDGVWWWWWRWWCVVVCGGVWWCVVEVVVVVEVVEYTPWHIDIDVFSSTSQSQLMKYHFIRLFYAQKNVFYQY